MNIEFLIKKIQEELDELDLESLAPNSVFTEIEGWNSLYGLILMALVSTEFDIELSGAQIQNLRTVEDLYNIMQKMA